MRTWWLVTVHRNGPGVLAPSGRFARIRRGERMVERSRGEALPVAATSASPVNSGRRRDARSGLSARGRTPRRCGADSLTWRNAITAEGATIKKLLGPAAALGAFRHRRTASVRWLVFFSSPRSSLLHAPAGSGFGRRFW